MSEKSVSHRGGKTTEELWSMVSSLRRDWKCAADDRDIARSELSKLAAWLRKNHLEVFKEYYYKPEKDNGSLA